MNKGKLVLAAIVSLAASNMFASENWSGGFYGIEMGAGFNTSDNGVLQFMRADGSDNSEAIANAFNQSFDGKFESSGLIGGRIGYNIQNENLVYGIVADLAFTSMAEEQSAFSATPATYIERREIDMLSTLRGRLGFASNSKLLPYLTAGLAYGDVDYSWQGNSGAFRGDNGVNGDGLGYATGLGADVKISEKMTVGMEYLYINLGDADFRSRFSGEAGGALAAFGSEASGGTFATGSEDDFKLQTVRFNVSWSF